MIDSNCTDIDALIREFPGHRVRAVWFGLMGTIYLSGVEVDEDSTFADMTNSDCILSAHISRESVGGELLPNSLKNCILNLRAILGAS
ncbi:hypothetical protein RCO22_10785 [Pseudomonas yamanorum]|uniref:Uncharacterized protein n=1 Tax=Pseudomonas yamanorum TaxID=515393 RepID=A0ABU1CQ75_9PSED|nr:hypothetical protein [Pseudomonas yamanorum]MDR0189424.1 hypothetical protein [Pseudomonas yamanorum]